MISLEELPVLVAVFLYFLADYMMLYTAFPYTIYAVCLDTFPNATVPFCLHLNDQPDLEDQVTGRAAVFFTMEKVVGPIPSLILAAVLGRWSDHNGRRLPMLIPCVGACLATVLFLLADYLRHTSVIWVMMTGFFLRALSGQGLIFRLMSYSHTADVVNQRFRNDRDATEEEKARKDRLLFRRSARIQAAENLGMAAGGLLAWVTQVIFNAPTSLCMSSAIHVLVAVIVWLWVRDVALCPQHKQIGNTQSILQVFKEKFCMMFGDGADRLTMWGMFTATFILIGCLNGRAAVIMAAVQRAPLSWPNDRLSALGAACSSTASFFLFFLAPCFRHTTVIVIGLVVSMAGTLWMMSPSTTWEMMAAGCMGQLADCVTPAIKTMASTRAPKEQVGRLLSRLTVAEALGAILVPTALVPVYVFTVQAFAGAVFLVCACLLVSVLVILMGVTLANCCKVEHGPETQRLIAADKVSDASDPDQHKV
ncbi:hypothetical protein BaRGS_00031160 [Batillaria attramentaria]|uniref:Adenylate cyclase n=1 Tax=Batillaria attramentaria TaxID=370345 RepID=A0ABD0JRV3_9CAEN